MLAGGEQLVGSLCKRHAVTPQGGPRPLAGARFQVLFTPLLAVLFTFPSRYLCAIGLPAVFSLAGWCRLLRAGFLRPRPTQGPGPLVLLAHTGLSPSVAAFSKRVPLGRTRFLPALQPPGACTGVWAGPLSLAATCGITVVFLSSGYLDVSVPRVALRPAADARPSAVRVAPFGHLRIRGRLHLPAAFRSLPRPSSPLGAWASPVRPALASRSLQFLLPVCLPAASQRFLLSRLVNELSGAHGRAFPARPPHPAGGAGCEPAAPLGAAHPGGRPSPALRGPWRIRDSNPWPLACKASALAS